MWMEWETSFLQKKNLFSSTTPTGARVESEISLSMFTTQELESRTKLTHTHDKLTRSYGKFTRSPTCTHTEDRSLYPARLSACWFQWSGWHFSCSNRLFPWTLVRNGAFLSTINNSCLPSLHTFPQLDCWFNALAMQIYVCMTDFQSMSVFAYFDLSIHLSIHLVIYPPIHLSI